MSQDYIIFPKIGDCSYVSCYWWVGDGSYYSTVGEDWVELLWISCWIELLIEMRDIKGSEAVAEKLMPSKQRIESYLAHFLKKVTERWEEAKEVEQFLETFHFLTLSLSLSVLWFVALNLITRQDYMKSIFWVECLTKRHSTKYERKKQNFLRDRRRFMNFLSLPFSLFLFLLPCSFCGTFPGQMCLLVFRSRYGNFESGGDKIKPSGKLSRLSLLRRFLVVCNSNSQ